MPPTHKSLVPGYIVSGTIASVDADRWLCTVQTEVGGQLYRDLPIPAVYLHPSNGEGVYTLPEVGAPVWLAIPSEANLRPFVMSYRAVQGEGYNYSSNRPTLAPGDFFLTTRDDNGIKIRRGGVVEVFASAVCRTVYSPTDDRILTLAQNLTVETPNGSVVWEEDLPEEHPDGQTGARLTAEFKEFTDHESGVVRAEVGGQIDDPDGAVLRLQVFESGDERPDRRAVAAELTADKDGVVRLSPEELRVFHDEANVQRVILGEDFLSDLQSSLSEISAALAALGAPTPQTAQLLANIATSLGGSGAPYLSAITKTE